MPSSQRNSTPVRRVISSDQSNTLGTWTGAGIGSSAVGIGVPTSGLPSFWLLNRYSPSTAKPKSPTSRRPPVPSFEGNMNLVDTSVNFSVAARCPSRW